MKFSNLLTVLTLSAVIFACGKAETESKPMTKGEAIPVTVTVLKQASFATQITASGTFTTNDETILSFKVGGIISKLLVQEGDPVKKGQILATLDLTEIQAGLNQSRLAYEKALRDHERAGRLYRDSVATLEQFENSKTALDIAQQQLNTAEFNLSYSQIRATQNGFVLRKFVNAGHLIGQGAPVIQINGASQGEWVLKATVNDQSWNMLSTGDPATILLDKSDSIPAKVIRKSQAADPMTGTYWIEVAPDDVADISLASGMFGRVMVRPSIQTAGWQIPYEALLDAEGPGGYVFVTDDDLHAKKVKVTLGKIGDSAVEVLGGLDNHRKLITSGSAYLTDSSTIKVTN